MSGRSEPVFAAAGMPQSALEGHTVGEGRFVVHEALGRGGMGEVYRALDRGRGREVALKVIAARYVGRAEREGRFRNEAEYARRVGEHPHVVSVADVGELADCGGRAFMTMAVVEGPTLAMELASSRRLPVERAIAWARQIASGLRAIHAAGLVHRDLTPSNVLIEAGTNIAKIFDFGLAGELDAPASGHPSRLTLLGEVPGTHGYMAPEQAVHASPAPSMDVYAFGVVLTEMLVGHNPFAHLDRGEYIEWQQRSREEAPSIVRWGLRLPTGLAELIDECLRREPHERPRSGAELLERLEGIGAARVVVLAAVRPAAAEGIEPGRRWPKVAVAMLLVLAGGMAGWWLSSTLHEPDDAAAPRPSLVEPVIQAVAATPVEPSAARVEEQAGRELGGEHVERVEEQAGRELEGEHVGRVAAAAGSFASAPPPVPSSCETTRKRAHEALDRKQWKKVLGATRGDRCWPSGVERTRLRVQALAETGQDAACVRLAADSTDVEIVKWRVRCEQALWRPAP